MPQLSFGGLSENWLLKEAGDRHWDCLANAHGLATPCFEDSNGTRLYAAFTAIQLSCGKLDRATEGDLLLLSTELYRSTRTQFGSFSRVFIGDMEIARLRMLSVFMKRNRPECNHSVERAVVASTTGNDALPERSECDLARLSHGLRGRNWLHFGFRSEKRGYLKDWRFSPCPSTDFNGADFLYFANYQSIIDRAEWHWFSFNPVLFTRTREIFFRGNMNAGEHLQIILKGIRKMNISNTPFFIHWCQIMRDDGTIIADVFSKRSPHF